MKNWYSSSAWLGLLGLLCSPVAFADDIETAKQCLAESDLSCAQDIRDRLKDRSDVDFLTLQQEILFYEGRYEELSDILDALGYPESDPEKTRTPYRKTVAAHSGLLHFDKDNISIRHANGVEEVLAEEAYETLLASKEAYKTLFGGVPDHMLVMDIFPTAARFIDASSLPPEAVRTTGIIALSKWSRLLLTSPRASAGGYGWKDTAAHEYIHLVISWLTDDHAPVWLQEGLAKHFEGMWRGTTEGYLSPFQQSLIAKALRDNSFVPFEKFRYSMAYLDSSEEAALAYAQVSSMVHFLKDTKGLSVFPVMMERVRAQEDPMQVMADLAGYTSFDDFTEGWKSFLSALPLIKEQIQALPPVLDGEGGDFSEDPMIANREDLMKFMRIGDLLLEADRPDAAWVEYQKVEKLQEGTPSPSLFHRKALCLQALGKPEKAFQVAKEGGDIYPEFVEIQQLLGGIQEKRGFPQRALVHWKQAHDINPFDISTEERLVALYTSLGNTELANRHKSFVTILKTGGASTFAH